MTASIGTRNARRHGILNGQRGTVREIDTERSTLHVELDGGKRVQLGVTYLGEQHLDHAYAITAHRAQGATVDRTFVLGSEELYREWGYTALSRHREEARFYVSRRDLGQGNDRDLPYRHDADVEDISRLLERTRAQDLATPQLRDTTREELEREHDELFRAFNEDRPLRRDLWTEDWRRDDVVKRLEERDAQIERLVKQREELGLFKRGERRELDAMLDHAYASYEHLVKDHREIGEAYERDNARDQEWAARHKPEANRFIAVHDELRDRDRIDIKAARQLEALDDHQPLERGLEHHERPRARGRDRGPDLDMGR